MLASIRLLGMEPVHGFDQQQAAVASAFDSKDAEEYAVTANCLSLDSTLVASEARLVRLPEPHFRRESLRRVAVVSAGQTCVQSCMQRSHTVGPGQAHPG